ncbi:MAG: DNA-protecting protein DprA [Pseudomonadales bacterium]|nr:DNA-processing protein DprA [Pseudomonadales bacterium]MCP5330194.1 DNA-protecting protein DprA [Pseudomonadales bacterium]
MTDHKLYPWLLLYHQNVLSDRPLLDLLNHFGSAQTLLDADEAALRRLGIASEPARAFLRAGTDPQLRARVDASLAWLDGADNRYILPLPDACYPPLLREIHDPPVLLFVQGVLEALLLPQLAIVGSRHCSVDGRRNTRYFGEALAKQGFSLCSGMARGIDTAAHESALDVGGHTVAVMGTGADQYYPPQNRRLAQRIMEQGALITELPLGSLPKPTHFPKRNRIISGMSLGLIVVEAALRSGSLITARLAIEHNREVFAVPGSIHNPLSAGPHRLLAQGAVLAEKPVEVATHLQSLLSSQWSQLTGVTAQADVTQEAGAGVCAVDGNAKRVLEALGYEPVALEVLMERTHMPLPQLQALLLELELQERVCHSAGHYLRC